MAERFAAVLTGWPVALALLLAPLAQGQINPDDLLPVEEAFALEAAADGEQVELTWQIAEGYYLYRHAFRVDGVNEDVVAGELQIPRGELTTDEFFGETETYRGQVSVRVPLESVPEDGRIELMVRSQGCADVGLCYPPSRERVSLQMPPTEPSAAPSASGLSDLLRQPRPSPGGLQDSNEALPAEEAFSVDAIASGPGSLLVRTRALPGYYLYREQFAFRLDGDDAEVVRADLPPGTSITDESFGETEVYYGEIEIPVHLGRPAGAARTVELIVDYQGCLEGSICYPPMQTRLPVDLPAAEIAIRQDAGGEQTSATAVPAGEQDRLAAALAGTPVLALLLFLVAGLLLAFTPCVFPMVPILSGLIAGEGDRLTTAKAFRLSLVYVLSMALVYTAFGVVAGIFGQNLQAVFQHPAVLSGFAFLFVLLSLAMFGFYELQLPASVQTRLNELSNRAEGGTLIGAAIMGALSALVVGPCVAPALMGALIYIGQTGDAVLGGAALFAMAMGMGIPLIVWGTSAGKLLPRAGGWMNAVKAVFGVGLLALAIWMLERVVPPTAIMLMWGALAIASGVYLGALTRLPPDVAGWRKLWQALGVIALLFGGAQILGALSGGDDWMRPLNHLRGGAGAGAPVQTVSFQPVETLEALESAIATAPGAVFLSFTAEWCVDCRRMERRTFPEAAVQERFAQMTILKVDVTDYTDDDREILEHFGLIGPPAYLFFAGGQELPGLRTYGFIAPDQLAGLLDEARGA
ncbi:protein-disulfide reductase DsbD [Wenzhouxiangella limi]|uniref:Thiol:disulfide interchange protein DsbD n=1 Tax=Wenzhouxiangella limi TaxID=2707351 RepID=A0A845V6X6_9GAMM|nr:protein-disulfide reductase DsbD [Wenzhouxiangella limi]NDY95931.1 protein-disulfide reductase DsbD [Wenzhouxiangella limi]